MEKYIINSDRVVIREIENHLIVLDADTGEFMSVEGTGQIVLTELASPKSPSELVECIVKNYKCDDVTRVSDDITSFINDLLERNIILISDEVPNYKAVTMY